MKHLLLALALAVLTSCTSVEPPPDPGSGTDQIYRDGLQNVLEERARRLDELHERLTELSLAEVQGPSIFMPLPEEPSIFVPLPWMSEPEGD